MSTKSTTNSKPTPTLRAQLREAFKEDFYENIPLADFVSSRIGGVAEYVIIAKTSDDLITAARFAVQHNMEYRVLGGGSATLVSEVGYPGLVIINRTEGIGFSQGSSLVIAASGVGTQRLVSVAASRSLGGAEFLSAVPGSIGGAVVTNAGFGRFFVSAHVKDVTAFVTDGQADKVVTIPAAEMGFRPYRSLLMRSSKFPPILLTIRLQLAQLTQDEIMRRLRVYAARYHDQSGPDGKIGGCFIPPLEEQTVLHRLLRKIRLPGAVLHPEKGLIVSSNPKTPANYRQILDMVKQLAEEQGVTLEDRLSYLGYWPAMEGEDATR